MRISSIFPLSGLVMSTSGSRIGTRPAATICFANLELLIDDRLDSIDVEELDDGAHFGAENADGLGALKQFVETGNGLHELDTILLGSKSLVDL